MTHWIMSGNGFSMKPRAPRPHRRPLDAARRTLRTKADLMTKTSAPYWAPEDSGAYYNLACDAEKIAKRLSMNRATVNRCLAKYAK